MWLHIIKGNVSSSVYTNYSCNQPPWDQPLVVSQGFSVLCNLMIQCPMTCCAVHIGTHKIFLEMISAGSWHLHALDMTSNVKGRGQMKMMRAVFGNESMARWSTGRGGVTEAHFQQGRQEQGRHSECVLEPREETFWWDHTSVYIPVISAAALDINPYLFQEQMRVQWEAHSPCSLFSQNPVPST